MNEFEEIDKENIDNGGAIALKGFNYQNAVASLKDNVLQGILDFGNAGNMPRINDFFPYYKINRQLSRDIIAVYNQISNTKISQQMADYIVLVYLGYIMYNQEKQGKTVSSFALMILSNFMSDLYRVT